MFFQKSGDLSKDFPLLAPGIVIYKDLTARARWWFDHCLTKYESMLAEALALCLKHDGAEKLEPTPKVITLGFGVYVFCSGFGLNR